MHKKIINSLCKNTKVKIITCCFHCLIPTLIITCEETYSKKTYVSFHTLFCLSRLTPCCSFRYLRISRFPCLAAKKIGSSLFCKADSFFSKQYCNTSVSNNLKNHTFIAYIILIARNFMSARQLTVKTNELPLS